MEKMEFTGFEPRQIIASKLNALVEQITELQLEVNKLKSTAEPVKKSTKAAKAEE